jgi:hypothetical protein
VTGRHNSDGKVAALHAAQRAPRPAFGSPIFSSAATTSTANDAEKYGIVPLL